MKNRITYVLAGSALLSSLLALQPVTASAAMKDTNFTKPIELAGEVVSELMGIVHNGTTYMPVWYVKTALQHLGVESQWDGTHHTWKFTILDWMPTEHLILVSVPDQLNWPWYSKDCKSR